MKVYEILSWVLMASIKELEGSQAFYNRVDAFLHSGRRSKKYLFTVSLFYFRYFLMFLRFVEFTALRPRQLVASQGQPASPSVKKVIKVLWPFPQSHTFHFFVSILYFLYLFTFQSTNSILL